MDSLTLQRAKKTAYMLQWKRRNPEKVKDSQRRTYYKYWEKNRSVRKAYQQSHREQTNEWKRLDYLSNPEKYKAKILKWRSQNLEQFKTYQRQYRSENRDKINARKNEWRKKNNALYRTQENKYRLKNRTRLLKLRRKQYKKRMSDPTQRLIASLRARIHAYVHKSVKSETTMKLLGCSTVNFWIYLESKFEIGMTRENYGKVWHIDHIMPCAIFDLTKASHQKRCFHFSNLQPMFIKDNLRKSSKVITNQFPLL